MKINNHANASVPTSADPDAPPRLRTGAECVAAPDTSLLVEEREQVTAEESKRIFAAWSGVAARQTYCRSSAREAGIKNGKRAAARELSGFLPENFAKVAVATLATMRPEEFARERELFLAATARKK